MNYNQIIDEILSYAIIQQQENRNGKYIITIKGLYEYFGKEFPNLDHKSIEDMLVELDARGWLLSRDSSIIEFDPAIFS